MGEQLAEQAPVEADLVMGVPESGIPAAEGYARRSGIPYGQGLVKNRYIGRTFIAPSQEMRALGVRMKLNPLRENIAGKRLVVRRRLDRAGHHHAGRWSACCARPARPRCTCASRSPPYRWPCFYGMDTGTRGELLAANLTVEEIRDYLDVDTLAYLDARSAGGGHRRAGRRVLRRLPHRRVPGGGAGRACARPCSRSASRPTEPQSLRAWLRCRAADVVLPASDATGSAG